MELILLLASLVPPIYLLRVVYRLDKIEPEPPALILRLFLFGGIATIPAGLIEMVLSDKVLPLTDLIPGTDAYNFVMYFIIVAITEEGLKHFALRKVSWNMADFNYRFDGVVYSVAAALGFAAFENVGYVFQYGLHVAAIRAVTSIPGHCIFGIYMGYYYGAAKFFANRGAYGKEKFYQVMSMLIPVLLHGLYDFCASSKSEGMTLIFLAYIVLLDIIAIRHIHRYADKDEMI